MKAKTKRKRPARSAARNGVLPRPKAPRSIAPRAVNVLNLDALDRLVAVEGARFRAFDDGSYFDPRVVGVDRLDNNTFVAALRAHKHGDHKPRIIIGLDGGTRYVVLPDGTIAYDRSYSDALGHRLRAAAQGFAMIGAPLRWR